MVLQSVYKKYYEKNLEESREFQDFVTDRMLDTLGVSINCYGSKKYQYSKGESKSGIEIKLDRKYKDTHNLYIEYAEKRPESNNYIASGIDRNDNSWLYCIGNYDILFILSKKWLQQFKTLKELRHITTETSKGYLLPEPMAFKYAVKTISTNKFI